MISRYLYEIDESPGDIGVDELDVNMVAHVEALKAFPLVNARIDGADIVLYHYYDIGGAVSTETGLMVPVELTTVSTRPP